MCGIEILGAKRLRRLKQMFPEAGTVQPYPAVTRYHKRSVPAEVSLSREGLRARRRPLGPQYDRETSTSGSGNINRNRVQVSMWISFFVVWLYCTNLLLFGRNKVIVVVVSEQYTSESIELYFVGVTGKKQTDGTTYLP